MKSKIIFLLVALMFLPLGASLFSKEKEKKAPVVTITNPMGGQTSIRNLWMSGTISDPTITRAMIVVNGSAHEFDVKNGQFRYFLVLAPGENLIQVIAENEMGTGRDTVHLFARVPKRDVKVVMTWDTATDIDLHVVDPNKEECYYSHKRTKAGGELDHDDTDGFGPETFLLTNGPSGKYTVKVKYYGGRKGQTRVGIQVVLFEGTSKEERKDYYRILTKSGEFSEVCSFYVE